MTTTSESVTLNSKADLKVAPKGERYVDRAGDEWVRVKGGWNLVRGDLLWRHSEVEQWLPFTRVEEPLADWERELLGEVVVDTFTVEDEVGLDALPEGARIEIYTASKGRRNVLRKRGDNWTCETHPGASYCRSRSSDVVAACANELPAVLLNPEILGEFHEPKPRFEVGEFVRIAHAPADFLQGYVGLRCEVVKGGTYPKLKPLDERPKMDYSGEGRRFTELHWEAEWLEKINDITATFKVGDRVRSVRDYFRRDLPKREQRLGVVEEVEISYGTPCVYVRWDDDNTRTVQHFAHRYELANDTVKPEPKPEPFEFEDNSLAVVMDEAGLDALPRWSVVVAPEGDNPPLVKTSRGWYYIGRATASVYQSVDMLKWHDALLVKHVPERDSYL